MGGNFLVVKDNLYQPISMRNNDNVSSTQWWWDKLWKRHPYWISSVVMLFCYVASSILAYFSSLVPRPLQQIWNLPNYLPINFFLLKLARDCFFCFQQQTKRKPFPIFHLWFFSLTLSHIPEQIRSTIETPLASIFGTGSWPDNQVQDSLFA